MDAEDDVILDWILEGHREPLHGVRGVTDGRVVAAHAPERGLWGLREACERRGLVCVAARWPDLEDPFFRALPGAISDAPEDADLVKELLRTYRPVPELARLRTLDLSAVAVRLAGELSFLLVGFAGSQLTASRLPALVDLDLSQHRDDEEPAHAIITSVLRDLPVPRLRLRDLALTEEGWAQVLELPELERVEDLDLSASRLPEDPRALFSRMSRLRRLRMRRMPQPVEPPPGLAWLDLGKTQGGAP